jgi:CheY-like chemotaxis protein
MSLQVLVVDDNRLLAENLAEILTEEGCVVRTAFTGEAALAAAEHSHFDLVLTDIRMPGMNGVELVRRLALREPRATFLLMTAYTSDQLLTAAAHLGVVRAVLAKPLAVEKLLALLPRETGARVLLVEDDEALAAALAASMRGRGYAVEVCATLASARAALASAPPDIVVIDGRAPDGDGMALARALCSGPREGERGWIPIVVFTGVGREADEAELRRMGDERPPGTLQFICQRQVDPETVLSALAQIAREAP